MNKKFIVGTVMLLTIVFGGSYADVLYAAQPQQKKERDVWDAYPYFKKFTDSIDEIAKPIMKNKKAEETFTILSLFSIYYQSAICYLSADCSDFLSFILSYSSNKSIIPLYTFSISFFVLSTTLLSSSVISELLMFM